MSLIGQVPVKSGSPHAVLLGVQLSGIGGMTVRSAGVFCAGEGAVRSKPASATAIIETRIDCLAIAELLSLAASSLTTSNPASRAVSTATSQ